MQEMQGPNTNAVWIALIGALSTMATTILTFLLTRNRLARTEGVSTAAAARAEEAVSLTVVGNAKMDEVHKVVNGKNDALVAENQRLVTTVATLEAQLATRRTGDPDATPPREVR